MADLKSSFWIKLKGTLFLLIGLTTTFLLLVENWSIQTGVLLGLCIWSFARAYYFAFYVIENYVDSGFHYSGLTDFALYAVNPGRYKNKKGLPDKRQTPRKI